MTNKPRPKTRERARVDANKLRAAAGVTHELAASTLMTKTEASQLLSLTATLLAIAETIKATHARRDDN